MIIINLFKKESDYIHHAVIFITIVIFLSILGGILRRHLRNCLFVYNPLRNLCED